jgi:isocitrate dehydrogenase
LQQKNVIIEVNEKLRATHVENNILKIELHEIQQKMKLQEERHKQETLELNKNLESIGRENEQLILESLLMDQMLRQSR